ncbi:MAG: UDP-N-acetylmuramoyl-L-alanyl-D-glutamate--2,6-diaminopimelate ligase [Verrucomicrobia bacterium]|nr:MAG: UDP-N-acetylmuramoyl-L-alanyl-D-glutamate--2,6-diaminopimelate ligase [Verrucomicrobiota bacterium]
MILQDLLSFTEVISMSGPADVGSTLDIKQLCFDSRKVLQGSLFFALPGTHKKGSTFVQEAMERGAAAVVSEEIINQNSQCKVPFICVPNARRSMADLACAFYHFPSQTLSLCGVTGTNGKTTSSLLVRHICETNGRACGLLGTIEYVLPGRVEEASHTTPESIGIQSMLAEMRGGGFKGVAMEVSSHALSQERVRGIEFDVAIFTNLTQDHLDYHGSMEAYFNAKAALFESLPYQKTKRGRAVINGDDRYGRLLLDRLEKLPIKVPTITYGQSSGVDFRATNIEYTPSGTIFCLEARKRSYLVRSPLIGIFNVYNVLGALASASSMGLELRRAIKALETAPQIPGRLQRVEGKKNYQVFIDYAHTPDALENVLRSLQYLRPGRLVVVFGCGGDRDRGKRPLMAAAAERYADHIIVTTDNPRGEDPTAIIKEVTQGFRQQKYCCICDRREAISRAIEQALPYDIIVIAGKGHETYQEVNGVRSPFDDAKVAQRAMLLNQRPEPEKWS